MNCWRILPCCICIFFPLLLLSKPKPVFLWANMRHEKTRLYIYKAPDSISNGVSVVLCPGGSYHHLGINNEGHKVAEWLNEQGITAFVLRYRVGVYGYHHPAMIEDLQCAVNYVRSNALSFNIDVNKLGVMGFSAGGHLALLSVVMGNINFLYPYNFQNSPALSPNFVVAVYPVVSMQDSIAHLRSRKNLLGKNLSEGIKDNFSIENNISSSFAPVFLVACEDDAVVNVSNSNYLHSALGKFNVIYEFLLYEKGGHGFGISNKRGGDTACWKNQFILWLDNLYAQ